LPQASFFAAHEAALHTAKLRVELAQSKVEQRDYLKNVELARVLDKRAKRKGGTLQSDKKREFNEEKTETKRRRTEPAAAVSTTDGLEDVLGSMF
jgi:ESF2/ABP1 family protein